MVEEQQRDQITASSYPNMRLKCLILYHEKITHRLLSPGNTYITEDQTNHAYRFFVCTIDHKIVSVTISHAASTGKRLIIRQYLNIILLLSFFIAKDMIKRYKMHKRYL